FNGINSALPGGSEVQVISGANNISRFVVNFDGAQSDVINITDSAQSVQDKLQAIPGIGLNNVTVAASGVGTNPRTFTLSYVNALGGYDVPQATYQIVNTGTPETQLLTFSANAANNSTFTLSLGNLTTATITYSTTAATLAGNIQHALNTF